MSPEANIAILFVFVIGVGFLEYITYGMCRLLEERTLALDERLKCLEERKRPC